MPVDTSNWTLSDYLAAAPAVGLRASNFVPQSFWNQAEAVGQRNVPGSAPPKFAELAKASLIARGIIYFKSSPGDCGTPTQIRPSTETQVSQAIASGIASMAGNSLPGIGPFLNAITGIFQHHDIAVANEQATICKVAGVINQVFYYYDNQVRNGYLSPSDGYRGIQEYIAQVNGMLGTIEKTCNAACVYMGILQAHADFVESYYPAISPVSAFTHSPGAAPDYLDTTPGGVIRSGGGLLYGLPQVGSYGFSFTWTELLIALAAVIAVFVLVSRSS